MEIVIRSTPLGEAPENVRDAWVGVILPVYGERAVKTRTTGVLSGPRSWLAMWLYLFLRRGPVEEGFLVEAPVAFEQLGQRSATALAWWQQNTPHLTRPGQYLLFHTHVCEVVASQPAAG